MFSYEKFFAFAERLGLVKDSCGDDFTKYLQFLNRRMVLKRGSYIGCYRFCTLSDLFGV